MEKDYFYSKTLINIINIQARHRHRHTNAQKHRQTDRKTHGQTDEDCKTDTETVKLTLRQMDRLTDTQPD